MTRCAYHITHLSNLPGIIQGGLRCDRAMLGAGHTSIGYAHIKTRRMQRVVPCAAGGTLGDYVPFYLGPRSPMLYTINGRNTPDYQEGQRPVIHLVCRIADLWSLDTPCAFSDRHAELGHALFSDKLAELDGFVDWSLMESIYWNNTASQPDRKERRQAEFLVHQAVPWTAVHSIGVIDSAIQSAVQATIIGSPHQPTVTIQPTWYY